MQNPCFGCENREIGCHGNCRLYLDWRERHIDALKKRNKKKAEDVDYRRYKMEVCRKGKKRRHDKC